MKHQRRPGITAEMRRVVARRLGAVENAETAISCHYCGIEITLRWRGGRVQLLDIDGRSTPELDHVVPLFAGGPHTPENLVPACLVCNRSKGVKRAPERTLPQSDKHSLECALQHVVERVLQQSVEQAPSESEEPRPDPYPTKDPTSPSRPVVHSENSDQDQLLKSLLLGAPWLRAPRTYASARGATS